jgi:hypothetical protein
MRARHIRCFVGQLGVWLGEDTWYTVLAGLAHPTPLKEGKQLSDLSVDSLLPALLCFDINIRALFWNACPLFDLSQASALQVARPQASIHNSFSAMKLAATVSTLLLVGSAVAAPGTAIRAERQRKRVAGRHGNPLRRVDAAALTNDTNVQYSGNWAGAVLVGSGYTSVTGTFTAPTPTTDGSGSAWVGIDGDTCATAILQTGIDWTLSSKVIHSKLPVTLTNYAKQVAP